MPVQTMQALFPASSESASDYNILFFTFSCHEKNYPRVRCILFQGKNFRQPGVFVSAFLAEEPDQPNDPLEANYPKEDAPSTCSKENFRLGYHFLHLVKEHPFHGLIELFDANTLGELQECWNKWTRCAVCVPYSAFSDNTDRRYLLRFAECFNLLIDALHVAAVQKKKAEQVIPSGPGSPPTDLQLAYKRIKNFTDRYTERRSQDYIWSVFECATAEGGDFKIERKSLSFDYECLLCIAEAPYHLLKHYPQLFEANPDG